MLVIYLPFIVDIRTVLLYSIAFLVIFHAIFLRIWTPGPLGWKIVDYIWIVAGALSLISYVNQSRKMVAEGMLPMAKARVEWSYQQIRSTAKFLTSPAVCRHFSEQGAVSDLARIQREFDAICNYGQAMNARLPDAVPEEWNNVVFTLPRKPVVNEKDLLDLLSQLDDAFDRYLKRLGDLHDTENAAQRTNAEATATLLAPYLLSFALMLRLSKVTAEVVQLREARIAVCDKVRKVVKKWTSNPDDWQS